MTNSRCTLAAIPSPDYQYIYAVGGFNGNALNFVERYSIVQDCWEIVTPMKRPRFMHACCFVSMPNAAVGGTRELDLTLEQDQTELECN